MSAPTDPPEAHYRLVIKALIEGRLVPFFGAGVNSCGRADGVPWQPGMFLPSGGELSAFLAENYSYPESNRHDLVRVSQYIAVEAGLGPLYAELRSILNADYPPTPLHQFFASLPGVLREKGYPPRSQLIVTTNYDDVMERAFEAAGEPFDVVIYVAEGEQCGKFLHRLPDGKVDPIHIPNEYLALPIEVPSLLMKRSLILKIHGAIDRIEPERDSYVITEDHYIDYLTRTELDNLMPKALVLKLKKSHFLFLGYSLRDWNLRVILHRIWREQKLDFKSWAIQLGPEPLDRQFWRKRDVDILDMGLQEYIAALSERLRTIPVSGGKA